MLNYKLIINLVYNQMSECYIIRFNDSF